MAMLPEGWSAHDLGDLAQKIEGGGTPPRNEPSYWDGDIPWASVKDLRGVKLSTTEEFISELGLENSSSKLIPSNTMIIASRMAVGKAVFFNQDVAINQDLKAFYPKENTDGLFLLQWYLSQSEKIESLATGSTVKGIRLDDLTLLPIDLPPLPEQQKIATILSSVDDVIEKTRAQIDKLKDLKTGMMQELLTKGIGHTEFKDSPVGRIPRTWDVGAIDSFGVDILDGDRGNEYPKEKDFYPFEHCLFLSAKNVTKKGFAFTTLSFITKEKDELLRKGKLTRGDIVITTRGTVGNIAFYDDEVPFDHIRINSGMAIIRNKSEALDSQFLHLLMNSPMVSEQVELLAFGSAQPQLTIGIIKGLNIPKPSIDEQKAIASAVSSATKKLQLATKKLALLESTKKALMQDLLTGKVRVKLTDKAQAGD